MNSIILTSGPEFSTEKDKGEKKAIKLTNTLLVETLKKSIEKFDNILFVCSSPDEYKKNEEFSQIIAKSLSLSGIKFQMSDLIDSRNWLFSKGLISNSDLIVLLGGNPLEQMEFFNDIELKDKLKKFKGCLMGISAGSINLASNVYCSKDDDIESSLYYKGLGLTNIRIEPHFDINDSDRINNVLIPDSNKKSFVALPNESFIVINKGGVSLFGDAYYFNEGKYNKIENNINEIISLMK